jgi:hypothetical protein
VVIVRFSTADAASLGLTVTGTGEWRGDDTGRDLHVLVVHLQRNARGDALTSGPSS